MQEGRGIPCTTPPTGGGTNGPRLVMKFTFDSTQVRLNGCGQPAAVPAGHGAQHPRFNAMTAHYVEFAPTAWTLPGQGAVVYHAPETTAGGDNAIDFSQAVLTEEGEAFLNIPLSQLPAGTYPYLRVSIGYQNFNIDFRQVVYEASAPSTWRAPSLRSSASTPTSAPST